MKWAATVIIAVPALVLGGLVALVEEPEVSVLALFEGAALACGVLIGWRWPLVGGALVALGGILLEWSWFTGPLEGDVQALIGSIGEVSPLWVTIAALISGALFAWAGLLERRRRA